MEKNTPHFLRISGDVPENKRKEFEQTFRFVFNQLPDECIEHSLCKNVFVDGHYSFFFNLAYGKCHESFYAISGVSITHGGIFHTG